MGDRWQSGREQGRSGGLDRPSSALETPSRFNQRMRMRKERSLVRERQRQTESFDGMPFELRKEAITCHIAMIFLRSKAIL